MDRSREFGNELRSRRLAAGFSLSAFADKIYYSKGYLSRVENGEQRPGAALARSCDRALAAGGALIRLQASADREPESPAAVLVPPPSVEPVAVRRDYAAAAQVVDLQILFSEGLEHVRRKGHRFSPRLVLPGLLREVEALSGIAAETRDPVAAASLRGLVARQQEYAGWMFQEDGDARTAVEWTRAAGRTAVAAGDRPFELWTLIRRAEIALYAQDDAAVIALCDQVAAANQDDDSLGAITARVSAQGHALAGDRSAAFAALDRCAELSARSAAGSAAYGTTSLADPIAMITGWVLAELGDVAAAVEILGRQVPRIPATSVRSRARFGTREALAYALMGELDEACALTRSLLEAVEQTASATVAEDLRRLGRSLNRWSADRRVAALLPDLRAAARPVVPY
jgi:hypothetical protein